MKNSNLEIYQARRAMYKNIHNLITTSMKDTNTSIEQIALKLNLTPRRIRILLNNLINGDDINIRTLVNIACAMNLKWNISLERIDEKD